MNREQPREFGLWSERQGIISFILLIMLCVGFYSMGLYVGRWSSAPTSSANVENRQPMTAQASVLPSLTNTQPVAANPTQPDQPKENSDSAQKIAAPAAPATLPPPGDKYSIQVATAATQAEADEMVKKLRSAGFDSVHVVTPQPDSAAQFFTVRVGPYDLDTAHQVADELQREHGFKSAQIMPRQVE